MSRQRIIAICLFVIVACAGLWVLLRDKENPPRPSSELSEDARPLPSSTAQSMPADAESVVMSQKEREAKHQRMIERIAEAFDAPITFYGKVVDQNGSAVANAKVAYTTADKFAQSGTNYTTEADGRGYFEIQGVKGAVLGVNVSKAGYYQVHNVSNQRFAYGVGPDGYTKPAPSKEERAVFILQKKGESESLVQLSSRQFTIPQNGEAVAIDLVPGRSSQATIWVSSQVEKGKSDRFDWSFEISAPGGGLIEREKQFDFEAPTEGYEEAVNVGMDGSEPAWKSRAEKSYFAKLANGTFARLHIRFRASDYKSTIVLESYLNPEPDHRNLEYDPAKRASAN